MSFSCWAYRTTISYSVNFRIMVVATLISLRNLGLKTLLLTATVAVAADAGLPNS